MQIQAKDERDVGKRIFCNGTIYVVDAQGALRVEGGKKPAEIPKADADKLLQNPAWEKLGTPRDKGTRRRSTRMQLVDSRGNVLTPAEPDKPAEVTPEPAPPPPPTQQETGEDANPSPVAQAPEGEKKQSHAPVSAASTGDPPIPEEGGEWADPQPHYSLTWLRQCARAYDVKFGPRSGAELLCQRITAAMYGGEESTA